MAGQFVVDASVVMAWCFADEADAYADKVLDALPRTKAFVPAIWPLEIGNVLLVAERRKRLSEADSFRFLTLLSQWPISMGPEPPQRMLREIFSLARECNLSTYDASYLDLAMRYGMPLATRDEGLRSAARKVRVPLLSFDD